MVALLCLLFLEAHAAPVVCDAADARSLLEDARIPEHRAPVTHPELLPGVALASDRTDPALRQVLTELCTDTESLSVAANDAWSGANWSTHTFLLTASETDGCRLVQHTVAISVGITEEEDPVYSLRGTMPDTVTPIGVCPTLAQWRDETIIGGQSSAVRLILALDQQGDDVVGSHVIVRRASPSGWTEQTLMSPAPPRLLGGFEGPSIRLADGDEGKWVVASQGRVGSSAEDCQATGGQTVWRWKAMHGPSALTARHCAC